MKKYSRAHNFVSAFLIAIQTLLLFLLLSGILKLTPVVFIAVLMFSLFAWIIHWFAPVSGNISHRNRVAGFFITLLYLAVFIVVFAFSL
jgi:hypothetical protein